MARLLKVALTIAILAAAGFAAVGLPIEEVHGADAEPPQGLGLPAAHGPVRPGQAHRVGVPLQDGDELQVGKYKLTFLG